jgi:putative acetyltransferase
MNQSGLRGFRKGDEKGVKDLILGILAKEYPFDKSAYSDSDLDRITEVYGGSRDSFFVIEEEGAIVATAGIKEESKDEAILRRLFVDQDHRRKGYGKDLFNRAVVFCKDKGYKKLYFRCTDRMADAIRLCMKEGFKETESLEISGFKIHKLELSI